ncbi:MAG TPA: outer membrane beta-barrel protein [Edaphocola sp.]|nr:outer membrane beta-barrel protein [Edaphocola sp.]
MHKIIYLFLTLCLSPALFAQTSYSLSGTLKDTLNFGYTQYTSVSLLKASDSVLQAFTRADTGGHFTLRTGSPGHYILLFEHPRFATFVDDINITAADTDLGVIPMISKSSLLKEVVIVGKNAISIKGDTIEYVADSFKTGQYENVEALLKKLPGLEVNRDGSIKAYGKEVKKMLVDGDEFFSDDPAQVSKMLRASTVQSVQVYDSKSKQAEQTGIDDGESIKTINLKLKDDAKHGYFGKIAAGGGLPDYWQNEAMINAFNKKRKLSAYAIMSNTEQGGLGWQERRDYGSGGNISYNDGNVTVTNGSNDMYGFDGSYHGQGLPKSWQGGLHYGNSWWGDTLSLNGSYSFNRNDAYALNNSVTQYILPDTQYFNYDHAESKRNSINHNVSFHTKYKIDSLSTLDLDINGGIGANRGNNFQQSTAQTSTGDMINENHQSQRSSGDNQRLGLSLQYNKKFRKKGRSFSASLSENLNHFASEGTLQSEYHLYALDSTKTIDQRKANENKSQDAGLGLSYTEPLAQKLFLLLNYHFTVTDQQSHLQSFNHTPGSAGGYEDVLDSLYSSQYAYRIIGNRGGIGFKYNPSDRINMTLGGDIARTRYTQKDILYDSIINYSYLNFFPTFSFLYRKSRMSALSFNYYGQSQQPELSQLQPVHNNDDPLNVAIGNPDLKQAFRHRFRLFYNNYKVLNSQSIYASADFSLVQNAITMKQNIDLSGRRTYQYVNVNGNYSGGFWGGFGKKIAGKLTGYLNANISYDHTNNFINNLFNSNNTWSFSPGINLNYYNDTILSIGYSFSPAYNSTVSDIRTDIKTRYWNFTQSLDLSYQLPFHFKLGTNIDWHIRQQLSDDDHHNKVFLWNAWIGRSFLKNRSLVFKIYANDILNQNIGYSRITSANQISESNSNTIQRYIMLSLTWNFTHTGGNRLKSGETINIK